MPRPKFITNEIYHIYNRGVEKRCVFPEKRDFQRFIHDMFEFNDSESSTNVAYRFFNSVRDVIAAKPRKLLVEILCFCLMPNHYHFLLRQRRDGGVTEFMRKMGTGYTNYFNQRYQRAGVLFQGKFKAVHVRKHSHLLYLPHYIHLNPLDLHFPEWRHAKIKNIEAALKFLEAYHWSSYLDFINKKNVPSVTQRDFLFQIYGSPTSINYAKEMREWLNNFDLEDVHEVILEKSMEVRLVRLP